MANRSPSGPGSSGRARPQRAPGAGRRKSPRREPRIVLRAPRAEDEREFLARVRASRALHRPWVSPPDTPARFRLLLHRLEQPSQRGFLVCRAGDGAIAGFVHLSEIVGGSFRSAYLGYYALAGFERQGFLRAGLRAVMRRAFGELKLHRLEANIQPGNAASLALVRSLAFRREGFSPRYLKIRGRWRDHERWAILAEEVRPGPRR